ncbi:MAG: 3'(2'),5'-bisphosphate nucleotidase CysQ [bacterium]
MTDDLPGFLPVARDLALQAGARLNELLHTELVQTRKKDRSLVTNADHDANEILRSGLRRAFPEHAVISEETGPEGPESEYVWLIDPLDGTRAFARGESGFSVMLGLLKNERPVLGVVYDPLEGHLYEAYREGGCFHTFQGARRRVRVSDRSEWRDMPLITSTGFPEQLKSRLQDRMPTPNVKPGNSVGVKVGYMVRGLADIYVNHHPVHYWDTCGPLVILQEAGGRMTLWDGLPLAYRLSAGLRHPGPTLATNGCRHDDILRVLAIPTS